MKWVVIARDSLGHEAVLKRFKTKAEAKQYANSVSFNGLCVYVMYQ